MVHASCAPPQIHVRNVVFKSHSCPRSVTPPGDFGWMDIIDRNSIRRMEIDFADPLTCHLRGISSRRTPDLLDEARCVQRHMQLLIAHPTALEELHITRYSLQPRGREIDMDSFQVNLPMLRAYDGPFQFYEGFVLGEMIELLELRHLVGGYVDTQRVLRTLSKQVHPRIRSLTVCIFDDPIGYLRKISALYPQLRHVGISIWQVHEDEVSHHHAA
ncbi:hypothetical protein FIBSPDRAFT_861442 [Athelia psychrophila]|uniref:Uncharacterized protein n=1 Tax=Athelia psychrophila TaxID=1759441 RepID=A0A166JC28_9AGAM|nr:hypothetical protein FIBSPDRAFT_861442 [Fibularhizoctonia sp. CBS 109695]